MKKKKFALVLVITITLWLLIHSVVLAVPPLPCSIYGTVKINGQNIPQDTMVSAWIDGVKYAERPSWIYQGESGYGILSIPGDDDETPGVREGGRPGDIITFRIGDVQANETAVWQSGEDYELDLTATMAAPTPTKPLAFPIHVPVILKNGGPRPQPTMSPTPPPDSATPTPNHTPVPTFTPTPLVATPTPTRAMATRTPMSQTLVLEPSQDTYLYVHAPTKTHGHEGELRIKTDQQPKRPLIQFDLTAIPQTAFVRSATMSLWTNHFVQEPGWPMNVYCYALERPWREDEATWLQATEGSPWSAPGADAPARDRAEQWSAMAIVSAPNTLYNFDLASITQTWVSNPGANHGLLLKGDGNISEYRFWSSNYFDPERTPTLHVTYLVP